MKTIRVKFLKFGNTDQTTPGTYANFFYSLLKKYYNVEISDKPDYIFYNEANDAHLKYDCVKIFYTGENVSPDFNFCDYAIGFDWLDFSDRYYRFPIYLNSIFYRKDELEQAKDVDWTKNASLTLQDIKNKTDFCSFVYSNYRGEKARHALFQTLSTYKTVNAGGAYLNNVGGPIANKLAFEAKHKFSIACENSSRSGYTTEKIIGSFMSNTIPIYWGDPDIGKQFNEKRFINCHAYKNFEEVLERIKQIDADDELYLSIVNEPIANDDYNFLEVKNELDAFLQNIFDRPSQSAFRATINPNRKSEMIVRQKISALYVVCKLYLIKLAAYIYQPFKRFSLLEKIKHSLFRI